MVGALSIFSCQNAKQTDRNLGEVEMTEDQVSERPLDRPILNNLNIPEDSVFKSLETEDDSLMSAALIRISKADSIMADFNSETKFYVKRKGGKLEQVEHYKGIQKMPEDVEVAYQIINDGDDILAIGQMAGGPGREFFNAYYHYFSPQGNTQAFIRFSNYEQSKCTEGLAFETSEYFFDDAFRVTKKDYQFVSEDNSPLEQHLCEFPYRASYSIYQDLKELTTNLELSI